MCCSVLQCVAVFCSVLQCALPCNDSQFICMCCNVLRGSALQCVAVYRSVLQRVAVRCISLHPSSSVCICVCERVSERENVVGAHK